MMGKQMLIRKFLLLALCLLSLAPLVSAQSDYALQHAAVAVAADENKSTAEIRQETFDVVWRTVKDKHFDPTLGGVDWLKVREKYEPRLPALKDNNALYALLQEMLGELRQSHFNIIPPEAIIPDSVKEPPMGGVGVDVRMIGEQVIVTKVEPESPAARAGIKPGFVIKKVGDSLIDEMIAKSRKKEDKPDWVRLRVSRAVLARINGKPAETVTLAYLDNHSRLREVTLERERLKGELAPRLGNFPPQYVEFEARRLAGNIGYIRFSTFVPLVTPKIYQAVRSLNDTSGLIFDLRGNPGGLGGMAPAIAGWLSDKPGSLGTMKMRSSEIRFGVFPQRDGVYLRPVVILIDGSSASTSEIFAGGMQELGRATVIGERSIGAALPSTFMKLPTGALFQYAVADFKTPKGVLIEGRGVIPDIEVKWERASLLEGRDHQLEKAIEQVQKQSKAAAASVR